MEHTSDYSYLHLTTRDDGVAIIQLNRPSKRNALSQALINELKTSLSTFQSDPSMRVVVLTGTPNGPFSSGADLKELAGLSKSSANERRYLADLTEALLGFSKPVIAAVTGFALGGGFELALMCDIIYSAEDAVLGLPEIKIGTMPGAGGTQHFTRLIGKYKAMELILTGGTATGREMERLGVVSKVFPADAVLDQALALGSRIATFSTPIAASIKRAILHASEASLSDGLEFERSLYYETFDTADKKEGVTAFLEKRQPSFQHK